jgi:hypothetical protein
MELVPENPKLMGVCSLCLVVPLLATMIGHMRHRAGSNADVGKFVWVGWVCTCFLDVVVVACSVVIRAWMCFVDGLVGCVRVLCGDSVLSSCKYVCLCMHLLSVLCYIASVHVRADVRKLSCVYLYLILAFLHSLRCNHWVRADNYWAIDGHAGRTSTNV